MISIEKYRNRKAVSPVIATVILVAVAITVSVGVSYWMSGISAQYTEFEKIEIQTGYSAADITGTGWVIELALKNSGSATSSITHLFVNDKPVLLTHVETTAEVDGLGAEGSIVTNLPVAGLAINAGESSTVKLWIYPGGTDTQAEYLSAGTTLNIKLHSAGGMDYIKLIKLS